MEREKKCSVRLYFRQKIFSPSSLYYLLSLSHFFFSLKRNVFLLTVGGAIRNLVEGRIYEGDRIDNRGTTFFIIVHE